MEIKAKTIEEILYALDQLLELYGYGGEYRKVRETCAELVSQGVDVSHYFYICRALDTKWVKRK